MSNNLGLKSLIKSEDWWAVWFGALIILVALLHFTGKAPKLGEWISNPLNQFESYERVYPLPHKPADLIIEGPLSKNLKYDEKQGLLVYKGLMSQEQMHAMQKFSADPEYKGAIDQLYHAPPVAKSNIILKLLYLLVSLGLMTAIGVKFMGGNPFEYLAGFIVIFILAIISYTFAHQRVINAYGLGYAFWALLIGLLISNTIGTPSWLKSGARTEMFIKTGLVLLGAEILFEKILALGAPGLFVAWLVTPTVIIFMFLFGTRILKMASKTLVIVIAAATSVCGVSAAIATAAACKAKKDELTLAVGMTLIFTVLMMVFMPIGIKMLGMDKIVGAAWMGGTIDATGAVVAAGAMLGPEAEQVAAVVKMIQNILIGVVAFVVAIYWAFKVEQTADATKPSAMEIWYRFPKFIVGFIGASLLFSFVLIPIYGSQYIESDILSASTKTLRGWLFCLAFVSIGLESNFRDLGSQLVGGKPILLYICGQSFNLFLTLIAAYLAFGGILFGNG